jgi:hypothetical protein
MCGVAVKTLPPTAGIRVLTLGGGGVCGLTTLEFLRHLQYKIGLPYPVQETFDVAFGTSSSEACNPGIQSSANIKPGGIIVLASFVNGWSVEQCIERFWPY